MAKQKKRKKKEKPLKSLEDVGLAQNFEIVEAEVHFEKKPVKQILEEVKKINAKKIAKEVIKWLTANVENYIDNHVRMFKLDLVLDSEKSMLETRKLQDLFRAIPDDPGDVSGAKKDELIQEAQECRTVLNTAVEESHREIKTSKKALDKLFKRLVYYYELKGLKDGLPIVQEQNGIVEILKFEYEAFSVGVKVLRGDDAVDEDGAVLKKGEKKTLKQYVVPEGFTIWIELAFKPKTRPISLF